MTNLQSTVEEVRALLQLVQRAPMSNAEALFTEALFTRWLGTLDPAFASKSAPLGNDRSDQVDPAAPASQPATPEGDLV